VQILVTGGSGVLGRALVPLLQQAGHDVRAPAREELDLFDPAAVSEAITGSDAIFHLATRIGDWDKTDRLRAEATRVLVDAALAAAVETFVVPTVTFVYPDGEVDEDTPFEEVPPHLRSALVAEREVTRFAASGRRGVVLRLGYLDGPGTGSEAPNQRYGATLHVEDAASALLAALGAPSGVYNVVRDGERVSNERFERATGWRPER
jgi:nucleoside-diphosphate-sugar epimerase